MSTALSFRQLSLFDTARPIPLFDAAPRGEGGADYESPKPAPRPNQLPEATR